MDPSNKFFDDLGRAFAQAGGIADGARREIESFVKVQTSELLNSMNLVRRDEFAALQSVVRQQSDLIVEMQKQLVELGVASPRETTASADNSGDCGRERGVTSSPGSEPTLDGSGEAGTDSSRKDSQI